MLLLCSSRFNRLLKIGSESDVMWLDSGEISSVSIWEHDKLKHVHMFKHCTTRYTTYPFFNYTRSEISWAYQHCKLETKKAIVIAQQSSAALHLQNVIKTFDMSFNEDKRSISEMEISLSFSLSQGGQRVHTFWEKTTLILMHRLATCQDGVSSSFHQATFRLWCIGRLWLSLVFFLKAYSTIFLTCPLRKICISSPNKPQQGTAINQQV